MDKEKTEIEKCLPAWYVELKRAYLKQEAEKEKKMRASSKLFSPAKAFI
ncbi:hypothetical protein J4441_00010 [Candidatus Micrarchaeota archaeon]|nr:hypothetical protein [Candidatus Micrarchaeota archaeon]